MGIIKNRIEKTDFRFEFKGSGHYRVSYTYPLTWKTISAITTDMRLIDATKNEERPLKKNLLELKNQIKRLSNGN